MIGIIGAMDVEVKNLLDKMEDYSVKEYANLKFYEGKLLNKDVVVCKCGVGKVNAAACATILCLMFKVNLVITTGIAGGTKTLNTKDICVAKEFIYGDVDVTCFNYSYGQVPGEPKSFIVDEKLVEKVNLILNNRYDNVKDVTFLTQDAFITSDSQVKVERELLATEMESSAIAHVANKFNVNVIGVRIISDVIGKASQISSYDEFEAEAGFISTNICLYLIQEL